MAIAAQIRSGEPLAELNTTPLIDVMLVLLVMFILSVPVAVHDLPFDLPASASTFPHLIIRPENNLTMFYRPAGLERQRTQRSSARCCSDRKRKTRARTSDPVHTRRQRALWIIRASAAVCQI